MTDSDSQYRKNRKVQTFTFGAGEIVLRVYDKSAEMTEASNKTWFYPLWRQDKDVWCIEWQLRKETLILGQHGGDRLEHLHMNFKDWVGVEFEQWLNNMLILHQII